MIQYSTESLKSTTIISSSFYVLWCVYSGSCRLLKLPEPSGDVSGLLQDAGRNPLGFWVPRRLLHEPCGETSQACQPHHWYGSEILPLNILFSPSYPYLKEYFGGRELIYTTFNSINRGSSRIVCVNVHHPRGLPHGTTTNQVLFKFIILSLNPYYINVEADHGLDL